MREALADCMHALKVQPWFTRAIERAAKCHLRLGEFAAADALLSAAQARPQVPAADARALAQRLAEVRQCCAELDAVWAAVAAAESADDVAAAERDAKLLLERMCEAFDVNLLHAAALLRAGRWRQAEAAALAAGSAVAGAEAPRAKLQAWWLQCETLYAEGELEKCVARLECGLGDLEALERSEPADAVALERGLAGGAAGRRVPLPPAAHVRERVADLRQVLQGRSAGNAAFTDKRYEEAARLYTLALGERRVAAPAFWARLYSNRAAAYQVHFVTRVQGCSSWALLVPVGVWGADLDPVPTASSMRVAVSGSSCSCGPPPCCVGATAPCPGVSVIVPAFVGQWSVNCDAASGACLMHDATRPASPP